MDVTEISKFVAAVHLEVRGEGEEHITNDYYQNKKGGRRELFISLYILVNIFLLPFHMPTHY